MDFLAKLASAINVSISLAYKRHLHKKTEKDKKEAKRPGLDIIIFELTLDSFKVYVGKNVSWGQENRIDEKVHGKYLEFNRRRRDSTFFLNGKEYCL